MDLFKDKACTKKFTEAEKNRMSHGQIAWINVLDGQRTEVILYKNGSDRDFVSMAEFRRLKRKDAAARAVEHRKQYEEDRKRREAARYDRYSMHGLGR